MTTWPRPVPLIGDTTSAEERAGDLRAWQFPAAARDTFYDVVRSRRDIRRYRPDAVPAEVLERVLSAAHAAPSVGHSQPWRFIIVRDPGTRDRAALLADKERISQASQLDPDSAQRLLDLQLEGIREAPLGVVVACDRRVPAAGVLGRATFPDADVWSCACAIQNLWLAARAEGLGVGWVTLFEPKDLADLLGLPDGVVTLGWLCLGWPDERPPAPGLERVGWSRRAPLSEVVLEERWPTHGPASPPSHLRSPDPGRVVAARDQGDALLTTPGSLGLLDRYVDRAVAAGLADAPEGILLLAVGHHPVADQGVSAYPASVTEDVLGATRAGTSAAALAARSAGLELVVTDCGSSTGDLLHADALTAAAVSELVRRGRRIGESVPVGGVVALGEVGIGNTTVACALASGLLDIPPGSLVGLGAGADAAMLDRKREVVVGAVERARLEHGAGWDEPLRLLQALGGPELCLLAGAVLGAAGRGAVVVLDGLATSVAALLAVRLEPAASAYLVAGQRSRERAHDAVLQELGLEPLLQLRFRAGEGVGAALAASLLLSGARIRRGMATTSRAAAPRPATHPRQGSDGAP